MVLPLREGHGLSDLVTAGLQTVGLRVPAHPAAQALLKRFDGPVAAPSANPSGRISPTTAEHVLAGLDGRIAAVLDDGPCAVGVESTIIGFDGMQAVLLRSGGVPPEEIEAALGASLLASEGTAITAPGQLSSHYAPRGAVRLNATKARADEQLLGFGPVDGILNLSPKGDLAEAAANLFRYLHLLDAMGGPIAVAPVPMHGLGRAINDRLTRAAAPRD
jgi:L-threonylcarbamoyladenylate synthase